MKFSAERNILLEAVTHLQKTVGSKSAMPVLEGILLSAEQGKLTLASYNLETGMKKEIYAHCEEQGDIVINARFLGDILRKMTGQQIEIEADEKLRCKISCNDTSYELIGMAAVDFPEMPSLTEGEKIVIEGKIFADIVKSSVFAAAQIEGTKPILTGIDIKLSGGVLQLVACDGYRLAVRRSKVSSTDETEFVASARAVSEVVRLIEEDTENIEITVGKRLVSFNIDGYVFICRLLEGEFVNYNKIIPEEYVERIYMNCHDLIETVERVSLVINDTFSFPVRFNFEESRVEISATTSIARAKEFLSCRLEGGEFEVGLNGKYLLEALRGCDGGELSFKFNGSNGGIVITSADENNKDFLYLIMPMRLK